MCVCVYMCMKERLHALTEHLIYSSVMFVYATLCVCTQDKYSADRYRANLIAALNILQAELPRTLVNLVEPINIEIVTELNKGLICSLLHL